MRTRASALPAIILVTALTILPTLSFAQHRGAAPTRPNQHPSQPINPFPPQPVSPTIIVPPIPDNQFQQFTVTDPVTGRSTIIQQFGSQIFTTTY